MANDNKTAADVIRQRQRERAKTGKPSTVGGQKELPQGKTPAGTPTGEATKIPGPTPVQGPKPLTRPSDVDLSTGRPKQAPKAPTVTKQAPRPKAPEAGRIQQVKPGGLTEAEMNVKAPGYYRKGRYMTKPPPKPPKKYAAPESAFKGKGPGETQRAAQDKAKAGSSYWQRMKAYATRNEPGPGPESTLDTRLGSIGKLSKKTFPGKASKTGGILDIPTEAAKGKGPSLAGQAETPAATKRRGALSLLAKQRKGMRVTGADVPGHGKGPATPTGKDVEVVKRPGELGEGHLGSYKLHKKVAAPVIETKREVRKETTRTKAPDKKVPWYIRAGRAFQKAGKEMTAQSKTSTAPSGKYGTKEQAQKGAGAVKKAVVPKKFKE